MHEFGDEELSAGNFLPAGGHLPVRLAFAGNRRGSRRRAHAHVADGRMCRRQCRRRRRGGEIQRFEKGDKRRLLLFDQPGVAGHFEKPGHVVTMLDDAENALVSPLPGFWPAMS